MGVIEDQTDREDEGHQISIPVAFVLLSVAQLQFE